MPPGSQARVFRQDVAVQSGSRNTQESRTAFSRKTFGLRICVVQILKGLVIMQTIAPLWLWATFVGIVLASLFIDFVVLKKQGAHDIGVKEALNWSLVWVGLSFLFNGLFWWAVRDSTGSTEIANTRSLEFLTGYLIEKSLAVDNIFVFLMIFTYFAVPAAYQKRVLMIGIIGAIVLRTVMILVGAGCCRSFTGSCTCSARS